MRYAVAGFLLSTILATAQDAMIRIDATAPVGPMRPIWAYFGYDEPNYTYMKNGRKLIGELADLSPGTVHIRAHNLLTTGDGAPALKWGSTNAYTEDAAGKPVYDWTIVDRIFDTYLGVHAKPFVELGFMPEAMSVKPQPYRHTWPNGGIDTGWAYPPKDYSKWAELIRQLALHAKQKYGQAEAESWYWEVWNEPDIMYWHGTAEEYNRLYETAVRAVKSVLPRARTGGPATTGPASTKAAAFLRQFLEFCDRTNVPLDFVSYHAKGSPRVVDGHVRMNLAKEMQDVERGIEVMSAFPRFQKLPIILSEADPEGCAACSVRTYPQNGYRNGPLYAAYTAAALGRIFQIADQRQANIEGILTWAFEFEDQPWFDGFRTLATNGVDKPVLNVFRMAGLMRGDRVRVTVASTGRGAIDALAAKSGDRVTVMLWNYDDDDLPAPDGKATLTVANLSPGRHLLRHYRIDASHSNSYSLWKSMGSPQSPSAEQYSQLEAAGQLQLLESPRWIDSGHIEIILPRHAVSFLEIE